jgi:hypothetical protein
MKGLVISAEKNKRRLANETLPDFSRNTRDRAPSHSLVIAESTAAGKMTNFPNDEIPEELQKEVLRFVENIHPRSGKTMGEKLMAYEGLIGLANRDEYKCTLCSSKYQLLPMIRCIFECESDSSLIQRAIVVVWYLSRNFEAKVCICDPELGLLPLPLLLHRLSSNYPGNINLHNCICNCSMTDKVHGYLFTKQFHYLELCKKEFLRDRRNNLAGSLSSVQPTDYITRMYSIS